MRKIIYIFLIFNEIITKNMIYAYIRISTDKQFIINQKEEILNFVDIKGLTIDKWVTETISGKVAKESRKLGKLLKKAKKGDTIIVTEISRLSRTLVEIMEIMGHCLKSGVKLYSIKKGIPSTIPLIVKYFASPSVSPPTSNAA